MRTSEHSDVVDRALVADAFARLPAEHRAVVRRAYCGWSIAQIAADLQIGDDTVKSRLHDGLRAIKRTLQEMGVER